MSSLYVGGYFPIAGGIAAGSIARWDGVAWHALGNGMNGSVGALVIAPDGSLYAGGSFTTAGGVMTNHIARWDGLAWHPLGNGMGGGYFANLVAVGALAVGPDGSLYAGGYFTTAGGSEANSIARWDGTAWHPLGSGVNTGGSVYYAKISALAFGPDGSLYAGGYFEKPRAEWKLVTLLAGMALNGTP